MFEARDVFATGLFPVCAATHDLGIRRLFDLATLLLLLDCRPGDLVLDLGAGPGFSTEMLARLGYDVVALDADLASLVHNRRRREFDPTRIDGAIRAVQGSAERLPFADGAFDGVLGMNVLHHLANLDAAVSQVARVLKPGCRAVFAEPGLDHLHAAETARAVREHGEDDRAFDAVAFLSLARRRGFSQAMLSATLQSPLRLLPVEEIDLYLSGRHPRPPLTPPGVMDVLRRHQPYLMLQREGDRPRSSRHPGTLACEIQVDGVPARAAAGARFDVHLRARNAGDTPWQTTPSHRGGFITAGCKLLTANGRLVSDTLGRTFLPHDVAPGGHAAVRMTIALPDSLVAGRHELRFDLVNEQIGWFSDVDPQCAWRVIVEIE